MGRITRGIGKTFDALNFLEMVSYGFLAAPLMGVGLYLGTKLAYERGGVLLAGGVVGLAAVVFGMVVRDTRRKEWSPISIAIGVIWTICIVVLIIMEVMSA